MSETKRIRVQKVEAADPELIVTIVATDTGDFPRYVQVDAALQNPKNEKQHYEGSGESATDGKSKTVVVTVPFTDSSFGSQDSLNYELLIKFSSDNVNWTPVPPGDVTGATGNVPISQGATVISEKEATAPTEPSADGSKNKGCLALFGLLPF